MRTKMVLALTVMMLAVAVPGSSSASVCDPGTEPACPAGTAVASMGGGVGPGGEGVECRGIFITEAHFTMENEKVFAMGARAKWCYDGLNSQTSRIVFHDASRRGRIGTAFQDVWFMDGKPSLDASYKRKTNTWRVGATMQLHREDGGVTVETCTWNLWYSVQEVSPGNEIEDDDSVMNCS